MIGTTGSWYQFNATDFVQAAKAMGVSSVTFMLIGGENTDAQALIDSDESATPANRPQLVLMPPLQPPVVAPQALQVTATRLYAEEGNSTEFLLRLAAQPSGNVSVSFTHTGGDPDIRPHTGTGFTPYNWNKWQQITIFTNSDWDAINGTATLTLSSPGLASQTITVTEVDRDQPVLAPGATRGLTPMDDAYGRDGSSNAVNFGAAPQLQLRTGAPYGDNRAAAMRFSLAGISTISSAKLWVFGRLESAAAAAPVGFNVHWSGDEMWREAQVNSLTLPGAVATVLGTASVSGTAGAWYQIDLTSFLRQHMAAGTGELTLVLKAAVSSGATVLLDSKEGAYGPQLVIQG